MSCEAKTICSSNAPLAPASENQMLMSSLTLSGCSAATLWVSARSVSVW
jgi:hypothetical protein